MDTTDTTHYTVSASLACLRKEDIENAHKIIRTFEHDLLSILLYFDPNSIDSYPTWISDYQNLYVINIMHRGAKLRIGERGRLATRFFLEEYDSEFLLSMDAEIEYPPHYVQKSIEALVLSGQEIGSFRGLKVKDYLHYDHDFENDFEVIKNRVDTLTFPDTRFMAASLPEAGLLVDLDSYLFSGLLDIQVGAKASQLGTSIACLQSDDIEISATTKIDLVCPATLVNQFLSFGDL